MTFHALEGSGAPEPGKGPLTGITVVSLAEQYPGPFATMVLADLGADVVLVERPGGDPARRHPALFAALNRNKRAVTLDLKTPAGQAGLWSLLAGAEVLMEGFRPGVMARLGFAPDVLRRRLPALVVVSVSSYGQTGPDHALGAHDLSLQARAGLLEEAAGEPLGLVPTADLVAGAFAALGAVTGLVARAWRGGAHVDVSMLDCLLAWQSVRIAGHLNADDTTGYPPSEPAYGVFRCRDGRSVALAIAGEQAQWSALCAVLDLDHLAELGTDERERRTGELRTAVADALAEHASGTLVAELERRGVSCGLVQRLEEVVAEGQVQARRVVIDVEDGGRAVRQPLVFDGRAFAASRPAPALGEHNAAYGLAGARAGA